MSRYSSRQGSGSRGFQPPVSVFLSKAQQEEAIVRKREADRLRNEYWNSTSKYFDRLQTQNERFELWSSDEMARKSEEAFRKAKLIESRKTNLLTRRARLRNKLETEDKKNLKELRKLPTSKTQRSLKDVQAQYEEMRLHRMEEQQKESEEKMLQHWRLNNPEYRELQCKKRFEMIQKAWDDQRKDRESEAEAAKHQEEIRLRVEAEKVIRLETEERESQRLREQKIADWKKVIIQQIEELKQRRTEESLIKEELAKEQERQKKLEEVDLKRKKTEEKRKMLDLREYLDRQHRLKLLAKTAQIQKDLDEDQRLLNEVTSFEAAHSATAMEEREEKNQRLTWLQDVIKMQKNEEAKRQKEIEMLFSEEAEKMWKKQESVWKKEEEARRCLMEDVLAGLKEQIRVKIQSKAREKEIIEAERNRIEEGIDSLSKDIQKEEEDREEKRKMFVEDLDQQVAERDQIFQRSRDKSERFRETNQLASQLSKFQMHLNEPVITDFRRKRAKWN